MMTAEIWKPIVGYEGRYEVSNLGQVRSLMYNDGKRRVPKILKPHILHGSRKDYLIVKLSAAKQTTCLIHRLVASAFVVNDNPVLFNIVNHKDTDHHNNYASNLEWVTQKENVHHAIRMGVAKNKIDMDKATEIRRLYSQQGLTYNKISQMFHINPDIVRNIVMNLICKAKDPQPIEA